MPCVRAAEVRNIPELETEPSGVQEPTWKEDFDDRCCAEECTQRQWHFGPIVGIAADCQDQEP